MERLRMSSSILLIKNIKDDDGEMSYFTIYFVQTKI